MDEKAEELNPRTQRVRAALMTAARELTSERPVNEISLTEVAERAQVSRPTVYKQFSDVPSLVAAAAEAFMETVFADIDERVAHLEGKENLYEQMRLFIDRVYEQRVFSKHAMYGPSSSQITFHVTELLNTRMKEGYIGDRLEGSPVLEESCVAISAGMICILTRWLASDFTGDDEPKAVARRMADTMLELSGGLAY